MIHYLRNKNNKTIIETMTYGTIEEKTFDLSSAIYLQKYSIQLLEIFLSNDYNEREFIDDIHELNELRGLYFEKLRYDDNIKTREDVDKIIKEKYKSASDKYGLIYVED